MQLHLPSGQTVIQNGKHPSSSQKVLSKFGFLNTITNEKKEVPVLDYHFHAQVGADGKVVTEMGLDPYLHNIPKE